ncbi:hypothetical protein BPAE_0015g00370 [Botrytis paeoniae]|uniref:Uncharacterized protein n=1 Tax=Botrytis paeoniae TaxID=278948 RepID=A0A4Z1G524_9HELO|nr:hypothetical protein BPAE_0015g00370 [Botrytis paeoniae]
MSMNFFKKRLSASEVADAENPIVFTSPDHKPDAPLLSEEMISRTEHMEGEIEGFRQLLCAMYSSPYTIKDVEELSTLTRIADFHCALPIVSVTLISALLESPIFSKREVEDPTTYTKDQLRNIPLTTATFCSSPI